MQVACHVWRKFQSSTADCRGPLSPENAQIHYRSRTTTYRVLHGEPVQLYVEECRSRGSSLGFGNAASSESFSSVVASSKYPVNHLPPSPPVWCGRDSPSKTIASFNHFQFRSGLVVYVISFIIIIFSFPLAGWPTG